MNASIGVGHHATWLANVVAEAFDLLVIEELEFINRVDPLDVGDHGSHILGESQMGQSSWQQRQPCCLLFVFSFCRERVVLDPSWFSVKLKRMMPISFWVSLSV